MDFSAQSITKLLQLFPELSQFIVTFKDITEELNREGDDTKVGICVLNFGGKIYFIPTIAKADVVQPVDSIFDPQTSEFLPLTKTFVDSLENTQSLNSLGKPSKVPKTIIQNPSLYNLVVPPRTGKFAYAGSRIPELLAASPNLVKKAFANAIKGDHTFASNLNKTFDLKNIIQALRLTPEATPAQPVAPISIITEGDNLADHEIQDILDKGYSIRGNQPNVRIAVPTNDFSLMGAVKQLDSTDSGLKFDMVLKTGETREGTILKLASVIPQQARLLSTVSEAVFVLFSNGDYSSSGIPVGRGEGSSGNEVFRDLFQVQPPITIAEATNYSDILVLTPDLHMAGAYSVNSVNIHSLGVTLNCRSLINDSSVIINAFKSCPRISVINSKEIVMPIDTLVVTLGKDIYNQLETSVNTAQAKLEMTTLMSLGDMASIGFDGVEYNYNNKRVDSGLPGLMHMLIIEEHLAPKVAESFVKQAEQNKTFMFYLSKKADFEPGEIPSFGVEPTDSASDYSFGPSLTNNANQAFSSDDSQTIEATLLAELLQAPKMQEYIVEYLPEIKAGMDKLGRILFLARLNMSKLFTGDNASDIFSLVGSLRNVYRTLGDTYVKLERLAQKPDEPTTSQS